MDQVVLERAADGDGSLDEREIGFLHGLDAELCAQVLEGFLRACDQHESGGVGVDTVKGAGHEGTVPQPLAFGMPRHHGVHERSGLAAGERLDGHTGGLVECEKGVVFEHSLGTVPLHGKNDIVGLLEEFDDFDRFATSELEPFLRNASVDENPAPLDRFPDECPACRRNSIKNGGVQPDAALLDLNCPIPNHKSYTYTLLLIIPIHDRGSNRRHAFPALVGRPGKVCVLGGIGDATRENGKSERREKNFRRGVEDFVSLRR